MELYHCQSLVNHPVESLIDSSTHSHIYNDDKKWAWLGSGLKERHYGLRISDKFCYIFQVLCFVMGVNLFHSK